MPFESIGDLLPLLIFVLIPLIQWLRQLFGTRPDETGTVEPRPRPRPPLPSPQRETAPPRPVQSREAPARQTPPSQTPRRELRRPAAMPVGQPSPPPLPPPTVRPAAAAHETRRIDYAHMLRNRTTLRRAIALMTILGPCRATAPYHWEPAGPHSTS